MATPQIYEPLEKSDLLSKTQEMCDAGYRLAAISVIKEPGLFNTIYSYVKEEENINLRLMLPEGEELESVSGIYYYAFLYENEMKDLFGMNISNINIDYNGSFYKLAKKTPFNPQQEARAAKSPAESTPPESSDAKEGK